MNRYALIPDGFVGCLGRRLALIRPNTNKVDTRFLFYYFFSQEWRKTVSRETNIGSTVDRIPLIRFPNFEITLPPLPTQRKIAAILSAFDDLIEVNTRRIKLLEDTARLIYREWFVKFRFPGHEQVKLVESEMGMIPEGWAVKRLGEVIRVNEKSIGKHDQPEYIRYIDISSVSTAKVNEIKAIQFDEAPGRARRIVRNGDMIWSTVRPNLKAYALILDPEDHLIVSTGFAVLTPKYLPFTYSYLMLTSDIFVEYLTRRAKGSAYPAVSQDDFTEALVLVPKSEVLTAFHESMVGSFTMIDRLNRRSKVLQKLRDLLLPKLISGQVDVSEFEVGESVSG